MHNISIFFQNDTLKKDSIPPQISADTTRQDTSSNKALNDSVSSQPLELKAAIDSAAPVRQKDGLLQSGAEKKAEVKIKQKDSLAQKSQMPGGLPTKDTVQQSEILIPDTSFPDTSRVITEKKSDTAAVVFIAEKKENEGLPAHLRNGQNTEWIIILLLFVFSILAWTKVSYTKRIQQLFEAFASNRHIRQLVREEFVFSHPTSIALSLVFLLTSSLLLTQANNYFHWHVFVSGDSYGEVSSVVIFFKFLFALTLFYIAKVLVIRLSASLFAAGEEITEYLFNLFLFNKILGLLLLPLVMGVAFVTVVSPQKIIIFSGGLVLLALLFRLFKCFYIGSIATKFSKAYIILYICTLEILPVAVVIKALTGSH